MFHLSPNTRSKRKKDLKKALSKAMRRVDVEDVPNKKLIDVWKYD